MKFTYDISTLTPYINWPYFYHAWQTKDASRQQQLRQEAEDTLKELDRHYHAYALFRLFPAYSDGDDIVLSSSPRFPAWGPGQKNGLFYGRGMEERGNEDTRIPCLRQQQSDSDFLCLADFISPAQQPAVSSLGDREVEGCAAAPPLEDSGAIGLFATSVDHGLEADFNADPYQKMMVQLLADRLAEATAELLHQEVRTHYWGYAPDEHLTMDELHAERFQGIRPAVGYPSLPDTSLNFVLDSLLDFGQIGIRLTESGAMRPHASVSGLMISHPQARYFTIGKIGSDQLADYARRRGLPLELMRRFLAANTS